MCDVTHQPRNVQVKLRFDTVYTVVTDQYVCACVTSELHFCRCLKDASPSRVTVSLEEPLTCQYILTVGCTVDINVFNHWVMTVYALIQVEAAIICELLETVDEYGMFSPPSE